MNLCSSDHEEVCYEGQFCPMCVLKDELNESGDALSKALAKVEKLEEEVSKS